MSTKLKLDRLPSPIRHHLQSMFSSYSPRSSAPTWLCVVLNFNTRKGICGSLGAWTQSRLGYHTKRRWECMLNYPYTGVIPSNPYAFFFVCPLSEDVDTEVSKQMKAHRCYWEHIFIR